MGALRAWFVRTRTGVPYDRACHAARLAMQQLDDRERLAVDLWLHGVADAVIEARTGLPVLLLGPLRARLLADVSQRLQAAPPARRRGRGDGWASDEADSPL